MLRGIAVESVMFVCSEPASFVFRRQMRAICWRLCFVKQALQGRLTVMPAPNIVAINGRATGSPLQVSSHKRLGAPDVLGGKNELNAFAPN